MIARRQEKVELASTSLATEGCVLLDAGCCKKSNKNKWASLKEDRKVFAVAPDWV